MPWFKDMMGCTESEWVERRCPVDAIAGQMGIFRTETIGNLWSQLKRQKHTNGRHPLIVRTRDQLDCRIKLFDTSCIQAHATTGTMVQVASNFNCQEVGSEYTDVFSGEFIHNLLRDCTQGPAAAGGAVPGAIYRASIYLNQPHDADLLRDTDIRHRNGKLAYQNDTIPNVDHMRVGLHTDVTVTFDLSRGGPTTVDAPQPVIDQVYVATCKQTSSERPTNLAGICLKAAYEGTYMCAALRKSKHLVLTAIGGESFCNNRQQIAEAMLAAHRKIGPYLAPDCQVVFPVYRPNDPIVKYLKGQPDVTCNKIN